MLTLERPSAARRPQAHVTTAASASEIGVRREVAPGHFVTRKAGGSGAAGAAGREYAVLEVEVPPGWGVAPHRHRNEDQVFYVTRGVFWAMVGGSQRTLRAGDTLFVARDAVHALRQVDGGGGRFLKAVTPSGLEEMFAELAALSGRADLPAPVRAARRAALAERFGIRYAR